MKYIFGCFSMLLIALAAPAQVTFERHDYATGRYPLGAVVGDFNGDAIPDLAVLNSIDHTVSVFLGHGDGTFVLSDTFETSSGDFNGGFQIITNDFNNDGHTDLAVASYDNTIEVFWGNGDGTFGAGPSTTLPARLVGLTTADFNGDGNADLAAISYSPDAPTMITVTLMLGAGDGTFTQSSFASGGVGGRTSIAAGDLNSDTKIDLVTSGCVHLGNGDGTFGPCLALDTGNPGTYFGAILSVDDFNGDGIADLALVEQYYSCHCIYSFADVFLGNGDGTFRHASSYQGFGFNTGAGAAGDFNLDGFLDLATSSRFCDVGETCDSGIRLFFGNGDGSLGPPHDFGIGYAPTSIVVADFDGDGRPDLAATGGNNVLSILLARPQ